MSESDNATYVEVGTNLKTTEGGLSLGRIHEYGTGPYTIRARNARVLAAPIGGGTNGAGQFGPVGLIKSRRETRWLFFGKEVHHATPKKESAAEQIAQLDAKWKSWFEGI